MHRITILWVQWSGYMDAGTKSLVEEFGCSVTVVYMPPEPNAPFAANEFFNYRAQVVPFDGQDESELASLDPSSSDVLLVCGWHIPAFRKLAKKFKSHAVRVLCMDNQWLGTFRQRLGLLGAPFLVRPMFETALVPGPRQRTFAQRLGFRLDDIVEGHYACDFEHFSQFCWQRRSRPLAKRFLFVGRLVPEKGIATLLEAWERCAARREYGWRLSIVGRGPLIDGDTYLPGVDLLGFIQPGELAAKMLESDVFVMPSHFEPWPIVIHEAAATGMPIICSDACGAGDVFVERSRSGLIVKAKDADELARAFDMVATMPEADIRDWGDRSFLLAGRRTSQTWAQAVLAAGRATK